MTIKAKELLKIREKEIHETDMCKRNTLMEMVYRNRLTDQDMVFLEICHVFKKENVILGLKAINNICENILRYKGALAPSEIAFAIAYTFKKDMVNEEELKEITLKQMINLCYASC